MTIIHQSGDTSIIPSSSTTIARNNHDDSALELLLRHSSPFTARDGAIVSPLTERTSSPSLTTRPRSNPRTRTPMRYTSPLQSDAFRITEERPRTMTTGAITIRPGAGRAVGTTLRPRTATSSGGGIIAEHRPIASKSNKQGPSHRKVRRWNNDNFVNLAAEINSGGTKGAGKAATALLRGHAGAAHYRSITNELDNDHHSESHAMRRLQNDATIRDQFFDGELTTATSSSTDSPCWTGVLVRPTRPPRVVTTLEDMLLRIEPRLRRVVIKACEQSMPASTVVNVMESVLVPAHCGQTSMTNDDDGSGGGGLSSWEGWHGLLLEPPLVTHRPQDDVYTTRLVFDGDSPNGGFHRLLIHGLCQFHGLKATSSTVKVLTVDQTTVEARLLVATGRVAQELKMVKMVDYIMQRKESREGGGDTTKAFKSTITLPESPQALKI